MCPYILSKRDPLPKAQPQQHKKGIQTQHKIMDLNVEFCDETHVIEVALADTVEDMRRKVASAVGLPEDSFDMSFGDKAMGEGYDMTQLSAGDTIVVKTKSLKLQAIAALRALGVTRLTIQRLKVSRYDKDPEVACLLLQAEVTTVIPFGFFWGSSITRLDLSAVSTVTKIENCFLRQSRSLTSVDLSSLNKLEHIGDEFLEDCTSLTSLDLPSLNSLTHVGDFFLHNCVSLTSLDLSSLENVIHIGQHSFECTSLETIRLSGCSAVVSSAVRNANLMGFVVDARPKRKRDESPEEDCKRPRLSQ